MPVEYLPHRLAEHYHVSPAEVRSWPESDVRLAIELIARDAQEHEQARHHAEVRR